MALNQLPQFFETLHEGHFTLILLGLTGALGQVTRTPAPINTIAALRITPITTLLLTLTVTLPLTPPQVFVFVTISKFGALNCALIGLGRKIITLALSFYLYGHTMNGIQMIGLAVAISCMIFNFVDKGKVRSTRVLLLMMMLLMMIYASRTAVIPPFTLQ